MNWLVWACAAAFSPLAVAGDPTPAVDFNRDIRPILSDACFACHGPDENQRQAELRFDTREGIAAASESGVLVEKTPDQQPGELLQRIVSQDPDMRMPPPSSGKSLSAKQIELLRRWIHDGAVWNEHWAYAPLARPTIPAGEGAFPVDRFLNAQFRQHAIQPAPPANRRTLIRRASLDLMGLPPSPEQVEAFVQDAAPDAFEKVIERLLSSPQFGERMASYWLDLVRYADSVGYHKDSHRTVWLYRDWVINAFNQNKPFDQFVIEQLAGDLLTQSVSLASGDSKYEPYLWKTASGFNRLNQTTSEGGAQAKQYLAVYAADRVRNTAAILLGSTLGCAECHDHKYDPFTTADFYRLAAFFADLQEQGVGYPRHVPLPTARQIEAMRRLDRQIEQLRSELAAIQNTSQEAEKRARLNQQLAERQKEKKQLANSKTWPQTIISQPGKPRVVRILPRGNWLDDSGLVVEPAVPAFLGSLNLQGRRATRLDLAQWIADRRNPLTARVYVNRLWKLFFGDGLCRTLDDLGAQGQRPTHPGLLDYLAVEFIESGWDIKHIIRQIVYSDAYRRRSTPSPRLRRIDPDNRLLARQGRFRLPAETVRDNALAIAGILSLKQGGRSVRPYQPANYWYRLYKEAKYQQDHGEDLYRRGLYTYWRRSFWHPSLQAFDAPSREECVAERPRSNTPQQSLVLLNDPTYVEAARAFAERIMTEGGRNVNQRIGWAYRRALSRGPSAEETKLLAQLYRRRLEQYSKKSGETKKLLGVGELPHLSGGGPKGVSPVELAAWTATARVILNLHETITRE